MPQAVWFVASIFATGAFWYFLGKDRIGWTVVSGLGALVFAGLAVYLHIRGIGSSGASVHRDKLADFLTEGQQLRARLNEVPLPVADHNAWVDRVVGYLRANLGEAYVVRLSDFSGMTFYGSGSERSKIERAIEGRSRRLHEFMSELK